MPDPRAAGRRRPGHHRRRTTQPSSRRSPLPASSTRWSTYDGAPHSFFDRKYEEFADASADAWRRTLEFIAQPLVILAIDQGTTGTTCLVVDEELHVAGRGYRELPQHFPQPGWVEHDPEEIWASVLAAAAGRWTTRASTPATSPRSAITNQRETTVLWERATGRPVAPAIVWQDRRTAERCRELDAELIRERTGLVPDPYFSATKLEWLLARTDGSRRARVRHGRQLARLEADRRRRPRHRRDERVAHAARSTSRTLDWDDELLALFGVDRALLPRIVRVGRASSGRASCSARGCRSPASPATSRRRSSARAATAPGEAKATYGTGSFVLVHIGRRRRRRRRTAC